VTKRREPLTYHHALTRIAALIGWDSAGAICGVSGRMVRYWSDPDCETEIRLLDAERLDRAYLAAGGDHAPFQRLLTLRLEIAQRDAAGRDVAAAAATAAKEAGEAVSALIEASAPDACRSKRRTARREAEEAIEALQDGLAALDRQEGAGG
jgi:hypothetical protein